MLYNNGHCIIDLSEIAGIKFGSFEKGHSYCPAHIKIEIHFKGGGSLSFNGEPGEDKEITKIYSKYRKERISQ